MKKIKFSLIGAAVLLVCSFLLSISGGLNRLSAPETATEAGIALVPAAGGANWIWLGAALIVLAAGIIILVLSKRRK